MFVLAQAPCCMSSFCDEFLSFLRSTSQQCGRRPVNVAFASLVKASWDILLKHALQLRDSFPRVRHLDNNGQRAFHTLKGALCDSVRFITAQTDFPSSPASDDASVPLCLKLGFGSPSTTGCLDAQGVTVKMRVLLRHPTSIQAAFANTGLHAIGLAGVRLPMDFRLPSDCGFRLISVGKADYNSVAVAFQTDFSSCFSKVDGIGSNRRLWLKVQPCSGRCFFWLVFYLPANDEARWHEEVDGIDRDAATIFSQASPQIPILFWMGDANLQPSAMGKGADPKPSRDRRWESLIKKWSVLLWNPPGFGGVPCSLFLPRRRKTVSLVPSDTHHCNGGPGVSRTLDLVYGSPDLSGSVVIHNSLHCKEAGCDWDDCFEFTGSDHFLLDVTFEDVSVRLDEPSAIKMPHHWHESSLWEHGFNRCSSVLLGLDELVRTFQEMVQPSVFRKACLPDWVVWAVEVLTLLLCVVESCVRDGWVLFADLEGRKRKRQSQQNLVFSDEDDFEAMLLRNQRDHGWPQSCVKTCLKWLKPLTHDPPGRLQCDGTLLSRADSHQAWVHHLTLQGSWPISFNQSFHDSIESAAAKQVQSARAHIGQGVFDGRIDDAEWHRAAERINTSRACTPFLLHRLLLKCANSSWWSVASNLQNLCGPSSLCYRPFLWRFRFLTTVFKKGAIAHASSYRYIAVADLHGLLQEELLLHRIGSSLFNCVDSVQTGYRFDVMLHQFTLHTLQDEYRFWKRAFIEIFADFVHAFPRAWRALILVEAGVSAGIRDGALALLASILKEDYWRITLSGDSVVHRSHGIPEGSKLGPPCFNLLPNTLISRLRLANCGVATSGWVPAAWASHKWTGQGVPNQAEAAILARRIANQETLPPASALRQSPSLEATCARALDLCDPHRIPVLFHADDPVFLASSRGEAVRVLSIVADWAHDVKASLHLGSNKTVVQAFSGSAEGPTFLAQPLFFPCRPPALPAPLMQVSSHKWLGLRWSVSGEWMHHAMVTVAACSSMVNLLCSFMDSFRVPLAVVAVLFELKVEATLRFGRWLWGLSSEVQCFLTTTYENWARQLLGAKPWNNAASCQADLGWTFDASDRIAFDIASVRQRLWTLEGTIAGRLFRSSHVSNVPSWASISRQFLASKDILDWPTWVSRRAAETGSYKQYVKHTLMKTGSTYLKDSLGLNLPWNVLLSQRAVIQVRRDYVVFGHVNGKKSKARVQECILCQKRYSNVKFHIVNACAGLVDVRRPCLVYFPQRLDFDIHPSHPGYMPVALFAQELVRRARLFWKE